MVDALSSRLSRLEPIRLERTNMARASMSGTTAGIFFGVLSLVLSWLTFNQGNVCYAKSDVRHIHPYACDNTSLALVLLGFGIFLLALVTIFRFR